jgi:ribosome biogenesis GTPase
MFLEQLGADERIRECMRPYTAAGLQLGRVSFAAHEQYRIFLDGGECEACPTGRLRHDDLLPAVGDWVAARPVDPELALIEAVLPRTTQFSRRAAGSAVAEQVIAANVDLALVVCALDHDFNLRRLERYLVLAAESRARTLVVLNKADLYAPDAAPLSEAVRALAPDLDLVTLSALDSVEPLRPLVRGLTVALLGSSGAGKSTIANRLLGEDRQATRSVRASDSRGRHTTTTRMLLPIPGGGAIVDNPGMREIQLWAGRESLDDVFGEIADLAALCRFQDCSHSSEPGCAVLAALESGRLDQARWESYRKLGAELRHRAVEQDIHAKNAERKKWKAIHKEMRTHPKYRR